ncbi:plastocyanin/azurin family copper-binding protein [Thermodesulfobacteriota bacterium]
MARNLKFLGAVMFCWAAVWGIGDALGEGSPCGTVSGTIRVWKTKVRSEGPKHGRTVVVFLEKVGQEASPPIENTVVMDQKGLVFIPHVLSIQKGTTVTFLNSDNDRHNVYFLYDKSGETLDIGTWGPGQSVSHRFEDSGVVITLCKLHLEMAAYIVVIENPYFCEALIAPGTYQASYSIENVPPGRYILRAWHKKLKMKGAPEEITVESGKPTTRDLVITKKKYAE